MKLPQIEPKRTFSYTEYFSLTEQTANGNSLLTHSLPPEKIEAVKMNVQRMKRIYKTFQPSQQLCDLLNKIPGRMQWVVLAEPWCGDGAQNIPVLAKIVSTCNNIELKIILRDENPEIMDAFLTDGKKAIPKLICIDPQQNKLLGTWGARPQKLQQLFVHCKNDNHRSHEDCLKDLHACYASDKGESLQTELIQLVKSWLGSMN
ncbi:MULTISPECIES: thioredoxin family protein [Niastella]|uniref:Thioredoxin family protein n=1 Tax=Niastella soli TaxID=2821487 RepID=A0ABS3YX67_9BACT|nr:thioredoxin family protein [Niastella soli]MBO9202520.1 thioredoxin family protein [Niastella soli]